MRLKRQAKVFFLNLFYRKLWVELAIPIIIIVSIPLAVLGTLLIKTSQDAVRNSVLREYKEIAIRAAKEIGLFIESPLSILSNTAFAVSVVYPAPWKQETMLVESVLNEPLFIRIASVNLDGIIIASSELGKRAEIEDVDDILKKAVKGKAYISPVRILGNRTPYLTMAAPIKKMGETIGVLVADINLRSMWDIVDKISLGETGSAFLVSKDGVLIAHPDKKRVLKNENLSRSEDVKSVLSGKIEAIEMRDEDGRRWISSYAPILKPGWGIILRQDQDEAYLFSRAMKEQSKIIIISSVLLAVFVSVFMARALVRPLKSLVKGTKSIAHGDLEYKLGIRRRDELGELIRSFNDMTEQLKKARSRERLSAIGEAAGWIAHELKNSLVAIKSFVLLFPKKHDDRKFVDRFSKLVPDEIGRWERMLNDLSGFSRQAELRMANTDLKALIGNILEIMSERFIDNKINVAYNPQDKDFNIIADEERLKQVLTNLFINAVNAMPEGGWLHVYLYSKDTLRPEFVEIRVKDTGKGIAQGDIEKVFEPFHTTNKDGVGLGLAISRNIIQRHGGDISVESEAGLGATFIVRLPRRG